MQIEAIPISQLQPAPYNPRIELRQGTERYERLSRSLSEFELVQPLVWNRTTGHLVGGHQRLTILKDQGAEEVPCVVIELTLEREKALNVTLNNAQVGGEWEIEKLADLLTELEELPDFDASLTGFSSEELRDLLLLPEPNQESETSDQETDSGVRVELILSQEQWRELQPRLDQLITEHHLEAHIRLPRS